MAGDEPRSWVRAIASDREQHLVRNGPGDPAVCVPLPRLTPGTGAPESWYDWGLAAGSAVRRYAAELTGGGIGVDLDWLRTWPADESAEHRLRAVLTGLFVGAGTSQAGVLVIEGAPAPAAQYAAVVARAIEQAKHLIDLRANELTPQAAAERAHDLADAAGLECRIWDAAALAEAGMGSILAVGAGSPNPPALVELRYRPPGAPGDAAPVALVGKGVTFDSGGLSLKSAAAMVGMHSDKAGAMVVLAVLAALRDLGVRVPVTGYLPLAENLPGPGATRPGDIITTLSGTRVEVVDTDFEGRLLMADALTLASGAAGSRPQAVIDIATLTYQATIALGPAIGAVVGRDGQLTARVVEQAERAGEAFWPLPWAGRYADQLRSRAPGADIRNHPGTDTGRALTAGLFLGEFVPADVPFAHLDIAGPSLTASGADGRATGFGVRTLLELLASWPDSLENKHD